MPLFTSGGLGLGRVILVLVLRIWSCLHHCQASELVRLAAPPQEPHPTAGLRPRFSAIRVSFSSLLQQSSFPQCIGVLIKTLIVPIFGAKECIRMRDFVFKIYKKFGGGGSRTPDPHSGRGDICSHPPPCPPARWWCPSASFRLATALLPYKQSFILHDTLGCRSTRILTKSYHANSYPSQLVSNTN